MRAQEIARLAGARNITDAHLLAASAECPVGYVLVRLVGGSSERLTEILHRHESDTQASGHIPARLSRLGSLTLEKDPGRVYVSSSNGGHLNLPADGHWMPLRATTERGRRRKVSATSVKDPALSVADVVVRRHRSRRHPVGRVRRTTAGAATGRDR